MTTENSILICVIIISLHILSVDSLECYACNSQDTNVDKCIKTTKQCEENQDICIATIAWGLPPYWTPYGDRVHYVWKDCDTLTACEMKKKAATNTCKRDWWDDWRCVECCNGDLCNHYVTLGVTRHDSQIKLLLSSLILTCLIWGATW